MRKAFAFALLTGIAVMVFGATPAAALDNPSARCGGAPAAVGVDGPNSAAVCITGVGAVTAAVTGDDDGYAVIDGDNDNPLTAGSQCLDGHAAIQVTDGSAEQAADDGEVTDPETGEVTDESYSYPQAGGDPIDPSVC